MPVEQEEEELVCTPSSLLAANPCLACYSELELLAALVAIGVIASGDYGQHGENIGQLMKDSACFTCISKKQMLQILVELMGEQWLDEFDVQDVLKLLRCLRCSNQKQLMAAFLFLLCKLVQTGPI